MVSITGKRSGQSSKDFLDVDTWLHALERERPEPELVLIRRACDVAQNAHAGQYRLSGEPYFQHVLAVANIVAELQLDSETVAAAVLHDRCRGRNCRSCYRPYGYLSTFHVASGTLGKFTV